VISGDTRYDENVIKYGTGADVLIHEVCIARPELLPILFIQRIMAHHTSPQDAGRVFSQAHPKLAAYTHLVFLGETTVEDIATQTRETYAGPLAIGEDLMSFEIDDSVTIHRGQR
jgi:ribonuclease Z